MSSASKNLKKIVNDIAESAFNKIRDKSEDSNKLFSEFLDKYKLTPIKCFFYLLRHGPEERSIRQHIGRILDDPILFINRKKNFWKKIIKGTEEIAYEKFISMFRNPKTIKENELESLSETLLFSVDEIKSEKKKFYEFKESKLTIKKNISPSFFKIHKLKVSKFDKMPLQTVPQILNCFHLLTNLNLSGNHFGVFPIELCSLTKLKILYLDHCHMKKIPEGITLPSLVKLFLNNNKLSSLPLSLRTSTELTSLDISNNEFNEKEIKNFIYTGNKILAFKELSKISFSKNKNLSKNNEISLFNELLTTNKNLRSIKTLKQKYLEEEQLFNSF